MKTYILKFDVNNTGIFPAGTVVKVTDDYWKDGNWKNTGFTVVEGKLKGEKGCVINGLQNWLIPDTPENREKILDLIAKQKEIEKAQQSLNKEWDTLETADLNS